MIPEPKYKRGDFVTCKWVGEHTFKIDAVKIEDNGAGWQVSYRFTGFYAMGFWPEERLEACPEKPSK